MIEIDKQLEDGVSVVIPFYNRSKFLKRLLDSIEIQTLHPKKIFIVDNGSSLEETNIAWDLIQSHPLFIKCSFLSTMKSGNANYARNLGYDLSETKYVAFLDSDDWWEENHLSRSIEFLKRSDKVAVYSGAIAHMMEGTVINKSINIECFSDPFSLILSPQSYLAQTSSYIVNKNELKNIVSWDEDLKRHQDYDYFAAIFYKTSGWCYCPEANVNIDWKHTDDKIKDIDFNSFILFYKKWSNQIPDVIKKPYILKMIYYSYVHNKGFEVKNFYREQLIENNFFNDWKYKLKTNDINILLYINGVNLLQKLRLKRKIKKFLNIF